MEMAGLCLCALYVLYAVGVVPIVTDMHWSDHNIYSVCNEKEIQKEKGKR